MNIDGSTLGAPSVAGFGDIFRNFRGFPHGAFSRHLNSGLAFEAELQAAIFAINKA